MPSEYQKWIARNEKPAEKVELTPAEKGKNWWYYYKWPVIGIAALILCLISVVTGSINARRNGADLQIAYIGAKTLPDDTLEALEGAFASFAEDITGDGTVKVYVKQYILDADVAAVTQLELDLAVGESRIFLLEDPGAFQESYGILGYADGVFGEDEKREEPLWYAWADCPALARPELERLSTLYIGRRGVEKGYKHGPMDNAMWEEIIADTAQPE